MDDIKPAAQIMERDLKILLVEDMQEDADLILRYLKKEAIKFNYVRVWKKDDFIKALNEYTPDLIIADHSLPQFSGMEAFSLLKKENKNIPFILVTGTVSEKLLTKLAKEGIDDYILKDNLLRLPYAIEKALNKRKIEKLHIQLENAYRDINDSINYAKIIQDAILPNKALLHNHFRQAFILYKPKGVLSGDFYWFKEKKDIFYLAVVDCTGHGVPGALMSMLGSEKLNDAVSLTKGTSEILKRLNKGIKSTLHQSESNESSRDGMDIALCSIKIDKRILKYAGANRPFWIIRSGQKEIEEIKATKKAIGGFTEDSQHFDSHEVKLMEGDTFYIFSDGYADSFGGQNNKKLKTNSFRQILLSIQNKTMQEQEQYLDDFIENWKAGREQIDDILVIGVRF